jgi:hypothetical protein
MGKQKKRAVTKSITARNAPLWMGAELIVRGVVAAPLAVPAVVMVVVLLLLLLVLMPVVVVVEALLLVVGVVVVEVET